MKNSGNTILVTGASSGIGRELARRFADRGDTVIVAARREDALAETIGGRPNMHAMPFDQADEADTRRLAREAAERFPALNLLVNNAGIMRIESIATARDFGSTRETLAVNLMGPIVLTDALVDHLSAQADAAIVNVTSGLAFVPRPSAAVYSATKAALHSYTVSLRYQLAGRVEVIELAPPLVRTEITPGQAENPNGLPLADFVDEAMGLLGTEPTPAEILVQRVHRQRYAEKTGTFDDVAGMLAKM